MRMWQTCRPNWTLCTHCISPPVDLYRPFKSSSAFFFFILIQMTRWKAVILRPGRSTSAGERVSLCWFPKGLARPRHGSLLGRFCLLSKTFSLLRCLKPKHMDQRMIAQCLLYPVMPVIFPLQCHTLSFTFIPFQQPIMECLALFDRVLIESRVTHT